MDKIVIESRLVSLRVIQKDKTKLSEEINKGFFFFLREKMEYLANMFVLLGLFNFLTGKYERDHIVNLLTFSQVKSSP